jgi:hypothetical protein
MRPLRPPLLFRLPRCHVLYARNISSQLTMTDPLVIYQSQVESNLLKADEAQFRAAVEYLPASSKSAIDSRLQKLSKRLCDYVPPEHFSKRIQELSSLLSEVFLPHRGFALISGTTTDWNPVVLTSPTVTFTREDVVQGRRSLFSEHASGITVIGGSGYREDHVNGFVLQ